MATLCPRVLESVASEAETFEQAFLANVVMAEGATVYERIAAPVVQNTRSAHAHAAAARTGRKLSENDVVGEGTRR